MKLWLIFFTLFFVAFTQAQTIATYQKKGEQQVYNISLEDAQMAYGAVSQIALNPPTPSQFMKDYVRYHVMLKEAYNDKTLITNSNIQRMIVHPDLKRSFDEVLYKTYASSQMKNEINRVEKFVREISVQDLKNYYAKNPYFKFFFIVLEIPSLASQAEVRNISNRARNIYKKVSSSQKPFAQLISLYSDNRGIGFSNNSYSRSHLHPLLYEALTKLKPGQISRPIRVPGAYYIVRLNSRVPFQGARSNDLKEQIHNTRTEKIFNDYASRLLSNYNVSINNSLINRL